MTKLTSMNLPWAKEGKMWYCEICNVSVPEKKKHIKKIHPHLK